MSPINYYNDVPPGQCVNCGGHYCSNDCQVVDDEFDPEEEDYLTSLMEEYDKEHGV